MKLLLFTIFAVLAVVTPACSAVRNLKGMSKNSTSAAKSKMGMMKRNCTQH